jgi:surface polysaccharide O-acyltransferase-like enzyme
LRGGAAFAVIVVHVGLVCGGQVTAAAAYVQSLARFAVPFFLAVSFYFAALSLLPGRRQEAPLTWLKRRAQRLLIPYAVWSVIYILLQAANLRALHREEGIRHLFEDPIAKICFGGSGVALYFLPLLFAGLVAQRFVLRPLLRRPLPTLVFLTVLAILLSGWVDATGNNFNMDESTAFLPALRQGFGAGIAVSWGLFGPVRILLVLLAHVIRCAPFILAAFVWARTLPHIEARTRPYTLLVLVAALMFCVGTLRLVPMPEALIGHSLLLLGLFAPTHLSPALLWWADRLGRYSFGIYLMHQVVLEILKLALKSRLHLPAGVPEVLGLSALTFASAFCIHVLAERAALAKVRGSQH